MSKGQSEKTPDIGRTLAGHWPDNPYSKMTGQELSDHLGIDVVAVYKQTKRAGIDGWASKKPMEYGTILEICRQYAHRNANANSILVREKAVQDNFNLSMSEIENDMSEINIPLSTDENYVSECPLEVSEQIPATVREYRTVQMPRIGVEHILSIIVIGHCFLVVNELADIFKHGPGLYAGIAIFGLKIAAVWISLEKRFSSFAEHAVSVCFLLDFLCAGLHRVAFARSFDGVQYAQIGYENMIIVCWVLSVVVSGGAFVSLFFIKKIANLPA